MSLSANKPGSIDGETDLEVADDASETDIGIDANELGFWSFIELAKERLGSEVFETDFMATEVLLSLNRAANVVTYDLETAVHRPHGLSWSEFRLMFVIWLVGSVEPKNAARLTGMSRAVVSNLAKKLEESGYASRVPGKKDGRSIQLSLTDKGIEKIRETYRDHNQRENVWVSSLTDIEQTVLVMLLNKLVNNHMQLAGRGRN